VLAVDPTQKALVNAGTSLVGFLRGQTGNEAVLFRDRIETDPVTNTTQQTVLGDIVDATPAYIRVPLFSYTDTGYSSSRAQTSIARCSLRRGKTTDSCTPSTTPWMSTEPGSHGRNGKLGLHAEVRHARHLPDCGYGLRERAPFHARREPRRSRRVRRHGLGLEDHVIGGANGGARGFYALDVTDPKNPKGLWEFCSDSTLCPAIGTVSHSDTDLGFTYGNPVIGKRAFDGNGSSS